MTTALPPQLPRRARVSLAEDVWAALGIILCALLVLALAFTAGYGEGHYEGAWGDEADERSVELLDHGYYIGGSHQMVGKYDRERFVTRWRQHYAAQEPAP